VSEQDWETVEEGLAFHACPNPCYAHEDASAALARLRQETEGLRAENERLQHGRNLARVENEELYEQNEHLWKFVEAIESAHQEHLRTGDYSRLGMAAQDAVQALDRNIPQVMEELTELNRVEHQNAEAFLDTIAEQHDRIAELEAEVERLRAALDRAGTRLAQVQPAIDPACTWALDIVPNAEREIVQALKED
jgi:DNA repair exonuclease SbcCD ATPase subunit